MKTLTQMGIVGITALSILGWTATASADKTADVEHKAAMKHHRSDHEGDGVEHKKAMKHHRSDHKVDKKEVKRHKS